MGDKIVCSACNGTGSDITCCCLTCHACNGNGWYSIDSD